MFGLNPVKEMFRRRHGPYISGKRRVDSRTVDVDGVTSAVYRACCGCEAAHTFDEAPL